VVGFVVVAFILVTEHLGSKLYPANGAAWRRLLIPIAGSLMAGFFLARYFPNARGSGIPQTKTALFLRDGYISFRTVLGKFGLCSLTLASGIALGREGPSVHIAAGIASVLGRRLGLSPRSVRALLPIGAAAALAAAFNTPIAAVLFTLEEVMGDMHAPVLGSIVLSSATSCSLLAIRYLLWWVAGRHPRTIGQCAAQKGPNSRIGLKPETYSLHDRLLKSQDTDR
jgi:CIC family chloride channel protein